MSKTVKFKITSKENPIKINPIYDTNWTPQVFVYHGSGISAQTLQSSVGGGIQWSSPQSQQPNSLTQQQLHQQHLAAHQAIYNTPLYYTPAPIIGQEIEVSEEFLEQIVKYIFEKKSKDNFQKILED